MEAYYMQKLVLVPYPKKVDYQNGSFSFKSGDCILFPQNDKNEIYHGMLRLQSILKKQIKLTLSLMIDNPGMNRAAIVFKKEASLTQEGYRLDIQAASILIHYSSGVGAFHAVSTLKQLVMQSGKTLPCLTIEDTPDFKARGIMLDISRDKIPTMETLYETVDFMADLKMNELQLYIEGFSFAYATFPFVWQDGTPVTGEEIMALDRYCKQRYIALVPNQNSFGHMNAWLARKEFAALADNPDGYELDWLPGVILKPDTLDPSDPKSLELIEQITADLLPYFDSHLFNVGCDETELGKGKTKELCEKLGKGQVYLDFILGVYEIVKANGKRMMFWGDIIIKSPELIDQLPKDMIALEWGYEANHRFKEDGIKFKNAGIDYYVCPGTSSWCSLSGRTDNMKANMLNAAVHGKMYGSIGYLITDWGDHGHLQYTCISYPGFAYGAALSWGVEENTDADIAGFLDRFIYQDSASRMGQFSLDLGNYYLKTNNGDNGTTVARMLYGKLEDIQLTEGISSQDFIQIKKYVVDLGDQLSQAQMTCEQTELYDAEFRNTIRLIVHGCDVGLLKLHLKENGDGTAVKAQLEQMIEDITVIINQHEGLWLSRNRNGGLADSVKQLKYLKEAYGQLLLANASEKVG
jgi:hexosaminidase